MIITPPGRTFKITKGSEAPLKESPDLDCSTCGFKAKTLNGLAVHKNKHKRQEDPTLIQEMFA